MRLTSLLTLLASASALAWAASRPDPEQPARDHWPLIESLIRKADQSQPFSVVLEHMAGIVPARSGVPGCLSLVKRCLGEPWAVPATGAGLRDLLAAPLEGSRDSAYDSLWPAVAEHLDLRLPDAEQVPALAQLDLLWPQLLDSELTGLPLLEALSTYLSAAHDALTAALEELSTPDLRLLFGTHGEFREAWYQGHFPGHESDSQEKELMAQWVKLLASAPADLALQLAVSERLARLFRPDFRSSLLKRLRSVKERPRVEGFTGDVRAVIGNSPSSRVVLGGRGKTTYEEHAALIIDLGGDDRYLRAAQVDDPASLAAIVIDLAGSDLYEAEHVAASATGGVAMLLDVKGKDRYRGGRYSQAASTAGVALLCDLEGADEYHMSDYGQGHGMGGVALLFDHRGDDTYRAWAFAQGGGLAGGLSALVDGAGDDDYLADLEWPDVYGDSGPEIYHGASQGYCTGIRSWGSVAGGLAALIDLGDGADRYQSGNFSQGGAYFLSFGLMYDGGGDDENFGTRYSQGFGVHQACAMRWDAGGDDTYTCRSVAHGGMAWDEGVGYLLDEAGDDVYRVGDLGLGGAAQTGVAVLIDLDGKDTYQSGSASQGGTGSSEYHDKPALGVLIDLGGDKDQYSAGERGDNLQRVDAGLGVFLDSKAKTFERALRSLR